MKVLVPYDGAELAEQAAIIAIQLLAQHRIEVVLLRVIGDPRQEERGVQSLQDMVELLSGSPASISAVLAIGRPDEEIIRCADQHGAEQERVAPSRGREAVTGQLGGQPHGADRQGEPDRHARLRPARDEAAPVASMPLHRHEHRAAPLAADPDALADPQDDQQHDGPACVARSRRRAIRRSSRRPPRYLPELLKANRSGLPR